MRSTVFILLCLISAVHCNSGRQRNCKNVLSSKRCSRYRNYCNVENSGWKRWMKRNCPSTCGFCGIKSCRDLVSQRTCSSYRNYCNVAAGGWKSWMKTNCPRTCGFCGSASQPMITKAPEGKVAKPGETVVFSCKFEGSPAPTVTWTKNGAAIKNATRFLVITQKGYTELHVKQITKTDVGDYMVTLRNAVGASSAWANLVIIDATTLEMTKGPQGKVAKMGETVVFSCKFQGSPEPTVTWTKGGVEIKNNSRFLVVIQKGYTEVKITQVMKSDDGNYMVALRNSAGSASGWAQLIVTAPPTPPLAPPTSNPPTCGVKGRGHTRIVGGDIAAPGDWPWQVTYDWIGNTANPGHWCGASIVSPQWILTAAHCFGMSDKPEDYTLTVGDFDIGQEEGHEQEIKIEKIIVHENYNSGTFDYDIALVKLNNPVHFSTRVRPVCLPHEGMDFATGTNCYVTGWGKLQELGKFPKKLYQAKVPLVDRQNCSTTYAVHHGYTITERMRCAGHVNGGIDACQGDSGGPLVCKRGSQWYLMGAVSWGIGCARSNAYGVYTDVTELRPWVVKTMKN